jgi:hypothetical protein
MDGAKPMLQIGATFLLAIAMVMYGCSKAGDAAQDREKLVGSYRIVVGTNQPVARKDLEGSELKLSSDGTFSLICRYAASKADSVSGSWSYSSGHVQFNVFRDCAGVWPRSSGERGESANLIVELTSPTTILLSPDANVRYEKRS